jgi:hypothetical protein
MNFEKRKRNKFCWRICSSYLRKSNLKRLLWNLFNIKNTWTVLKVGKPYSKEKQLCSYINFEFEKFERVFKLHLKNYWNYKKKCCLWPFVNLKAWTQCPNFVKSNKLFCCFANLKSWKVANLVHSVPNKFSKGLTGDFNS